MTSNSEQLIIQKTLSGDTQAFAQIVAEYHKFVYSVVLRMVKTREDAEEITQDVFVKVFNSLHAYKGKSKFSTWLYTIAYRKALDKIRSNKRNVDIESLDNIHAETFNLSKNALDSLEEKEKTALIKSSIQKLNPEVASIFTFYYFEELSVKEISKITNLSQDNIKIKLHRGRNKLYTILQEDLVSETTSYEGK